MLEINSIPEFIRIYLPRRCCGRVVTVVVMIIITTCLKINVAIKNPRRSRLNLCRGGPYPTHPEQAGPLSSCSLTYTPSLILSIWPLVFIRVISINSCSALRGLESRMGRRPVEFRLSTSHCFMATLDAAALSHLPPSLPPCSLVSRRKEPSSIQLHGNNINGYARREEK